MEQYIIQTESLIEAVRKIKEQLDTISILKVGDKIYSHGIHGDLYLVYRTEAEDYLVFDDEEAVSEYLGEREEHAIDNHYKFGENVEYYHIWKYVHERVYVGNPILRDDYKKVCFTKQGDEGTNRYIRKRVHLVGEPVITWSVG